MHFQLIALTIFRFSFSYLHHFESRSLCFLSSNIALFLCFQHFQNLTDFLAMISFKQKYFLQLKSTPVQSLTTQPRNISFVSTHYWFVSHSSSVSSSKCLNVSSQCAIIELTLTSIGLCFSNSNNNDSINCLRNSIVSFHRTIWSYVSTWLHLEHRSSTILLLIRESLESQWLKPCEYFIIKGLYLLLRMCSSLHNLQNRTYVLVFLSYSFLHCFASMILKVS